MAVTSIIFTGDLLHASNTGVTISAVASSGSATQAGYDVNHVRDTNLLTAWKPPDSTTINYSIVIDGGSTTWIGAAGETAYFAIAYDARNNEQTAIKLEYDSTSPETTAFASPISAVYLNPVVTNGTGVVCYYSSFTIPATAKRYYRVMLDGGERSEAAGSKTPKIYAVSMFDKDTVINLGTSPYGADAPGQGRVSPFARSGIAQSIVGSTMANKFAEGGIRFETRFQPASSTLWQALRDNLALGQAGGVRANFIQHEGLKNSGTSNFFMARMVSPEVTTQRDYIDAYEASILWETEPWL